MLSGPIMRRRTSPIALGAILGATLASAGPCDIYASGNTPCAAAHSSVRALYDGYTGPLYQLLRSSDQATTDIHPLSAGSVADSGSHDAFCAGATCLISIIYDQSGNANHLTQAPPGGAATGPTANGNDWLAGSDGAPVSLNGKKAYGVFVSPKTGYRNDVTKGIATGDQAQGIYAVFDGTHYDDQCCFDYGNAETNNHDTGNGAMEAIYFGTVSGWGTGSGSGPWIMADLENGLFSGSDPKNNPADPTVTSRFLTAVVKGEPGTWAIRGGDATQGQLSTYYNGQRPSGGYNPMSKQGAIILGIGGDNSDGSQGTFYEGVMTSGYPTDDIENQVQANIVQAGYATTPLTSGPELNVGSHISIRALTAGSDTRYIAHSSGTVNTQVVTGSSDSGLKAQASWVVREGLGNNACFTFESVDSPGNFIRHYNFALQINTDDGSKQMHEDATFCSIPAVNGQSGGNTFRSWSYPSHYIRHYQNVVYISTDGGQNAWDNANLFNDDISFQVSAGFA